MDLDLNNLFDTVKALFMLMGTADQDFACHLTEFGSLIRNWCIEELI
jgi:hypothetical protein